MKAYDKRVESSRMKQHPLGKGTMGGLFRFRFGGRMLIVLSSCGEEWETLEIRAHGKNKPPHRNEVETMRRFFFKDSELVVEYHYPPATHTRKSSLIIRLAHAVNQTIPTPPSGGLVWEQVGGQL